MKSGRATRTVGGFTGIPALVLLAAAVLAQLLLPLAQTRHLEEERGGTAACAPERPDCHVHGNGDPAPEPATPHSPHAPHAPHDESSCPTCHTIAAARQADMVAPIAVLQFQMAAAGPARFGPDWVLGSGPERAVRSSRGPPA